MTVVDPKKSTLSVEWNGEIYEYEYLCDTHAITGAVDDSRPEWDESTEYTVGAEVKIDAIKRVFKLAADTSQGVFPPSDPESWVDMGGVSEMRMFDDKMNTQTEFGESATIEVGFDQCNTLALLNVDGVVSVRVDVLDDGGNTVQTRSVSMRDFGVLSLYDYWYRPIVEKHLFFGLDFEWVPGARLRVSIDGGDQRIGALVVGTAERVGCTLRDASVGYEDYSVRRVDQFGNTTFVKRGYSTLIDAMVVIDIADVDMTLATLAKMRGQLSLIVGDERDGGFESMVTLGSIEKVTIPLDRERTAYPIKIIGVI